MEIKELDALMFRKMFIAGARCLEFQKNYINDLNVFPVPDGDTGTNMSLTISSAAQTVADLTDPTIEEVAKAISSGSLRGARGNSGVILSQIFRGFYKGLKGQEVMTALTISAAMTKAVETAYKAVMKPKEGTILTVAKSLSDRAEEICHNDMQIGDFMDAILAAGDDTLSRTPDMLPVLKETGVVDAGGQGLMTILHGAVDAFYGKEPEENQETVAEPLYHFNYETEFLVLADAVLVSSDEAILRNSMEAAGEKVKLLIKGQEIKGHVVTNDPHVLIQKAASYGQLVTARVRNVNLPLYEGDIFTEADEKKESTQVQEDIKSIHEHKEVAFIAVAAGDGLSDIFTKCGVDIVIKGGQTMNPSTEDFLKAIEEVNADTVFIFPNNKNIVMAAKQAALLTNSCHVEVIPTKTIPQGITAMINYVPENSAEDNAKAMLEEISHVKTGQVTYAVRDTSIDGKTIHEGDIMGITDEGISAVGEDIKAVAMDMLKEMVDDESELISLYNGADFSQKDADELRAMVEEAYPDCDIELNYGGQAVYYCICSVE